METFLGGLFNSKRFWVGIVGLVIFLVGLQFPIVALHADLFGSIISAIVLALIGGYSIEQTAAAWKAKPTTPEGMLLDVLAELQNVIARSTATDNTPVQPNAPSGGAVASVGLASAQG